MSNQDEKWEVISSYTAQDAIRDGVLSPLGKSNHLITTNLLVELKEKHSMQTEEALRFALCELLPLVSYAFKTYENGRILKSNYKFKVGNYKHSEIIWYMPNELGGITMMMPGDY